MSLTSERYSEHSRVCKRSLESVYAIVELSSLKHVAGMHSISEPCLLQFWQSEVIVTHIIM